MPCCVRPTASLHACSPCSFNGGKGTGNPMGQAAKTGAAGGIVVLAATYVFLFLFGSEDEAVSSGEVKVEKH